MRHAPMSYDPDPSMDRSLPDHMVGPERRASVARPLPYCSARALALWPGLDRARLLRTKGDPARIAALVTRRTVYSPDRVIAMLTREPEPRP